MSEHFVEVEGVRLRAVVTGPDLGSAPPIVVLHGFTGDVSSMACVAEALDPGRPAIRLELVGHGRSDVPEDPACYSMAACVRHVQGVMGKLGLERPHLLGYSMGGRVALSVAAADPARIRSLVLVGATAGIAEEDLRSDRIRSDETLATRIEEEGIERFVDHWMSIPLFASQARLGEAALAEARKQREANSTRGLALSLCGMGAGAQPPIHAHLGRIDRPVLLVVGDEDEKFNGIANDLEAALPRATISILSSAGHAAHLEAPEAFRRVVEEHLDESERADGVDLMGGRLG